MFLLWFGLTAHLLKSSKLFLNDQKGGALFRELLLQSDHIYIIFYSKSVKKNKKMSIFFSCHKNMHIVLVQVCKMFID